VLVVFESRPPPEPNKASLWTERRRVPKAQNSLLHAARIVKIIEIYPLETEKTHDLHDGA